MKQTVYAAVLAGTALATEASTMSRLMQQAPFSFQNSNRNDSDLRRGFPKFAAPSNQSIQRPPEEFEFLEGDELVKKAERVRRAAIKDEILALRPEVRPLFPGSDAWEPVADNAPPQLSPIFLTDDRFTKDMPKEEKQLFEDNDFGGYKKPFIQSSFPLVSQEVQNFFSVGVDCKCKKEEVAFTHPEYKRLPFPDSIAPVYEPQYKDKSYVMPKQQQKTCYQGDDYGGHNIPYPHPKPPTPAAIYDDAFINLDDFFKGFGGLGGFESGFSGHNLNNLYGPQQQGYAGEGYNNQYDNGLGYGADSYSNDHPFGGIGSLSSRINTSGHGIGSGIGYGSGDLGIGSIGAGIGSSLGSLRNIGHDAGYSGNNYSSGYGDNYDSNSYGYDGDDYGYGDDSYSNGYGDQDYGYDY